MKFLGQGIHLNTEFLFTQSLKIICTEFAVCLCLGCALAVTSMKSGGEFPVPVLLVQKAADFIAHWILNVWIRDAVSLYQCMSFRTQK